MLEFNEEKHLYTWNGNPVVSTTQVTTRIAVREEDDNPWRSLAGSEFMVDNERASKFGTEFHKAAALIVAGKEADYDSELQPWIDGLHMFLIDNKFDNIFDGIVERSMYSRLGFAGTMDWYFSLHEGKFIVDWKTATGINKKVSRMQTAAYANLIRENCGLRSNAKFNRWTVRLDPKLKLGYEVDKRSTEAEDWNNFLSCLNVYKNFT